MIGKTVARYRIVERLGRGAMGEVYRAEDVRLRRDVALKFLVEDKVDEHSRKRFIREAQAVSRLDHQNICTVYEIDEAPDHRMYIAMGYYKGESLRQRLARGPMAVPDAIETAIEVLSGLDYAHERGVVHRDLKPANLIIEDSGNTRIVDFGLAKLANYTSMTDAGAAVGTIAYMSPEQATGKAVDGRSDIFSTGIVLYEMITGRSPFDSDTAAAILYKILHEDPKPLSSSQTPVAPELNRIIARALAKQAGDRFQTAAEFRDALLSVLDRLDPVRASRRRRLIERVRYRAPRRAIMTAGIVIVTAIVITALLWGRLGDQGESASIHGSGVAVLPFSADKGSAGLAAGLEEDISLRLLEGTASTADVWVFPMDRVRITGTSAAEDAAAQLGVDRVLSGTVRDGPGGFEITLRLVDAVAGSVQRSESVLVGGDRTDWKDPVAPALIRLLGLPEGTGGSAMSRMGPRNAAAYRAYLTATGLAGDTGTLDGAIGACRLAVAEDSSFAIAHAKLGLLLLRLPSVSDSVRSIAVEHLRTAVRMAPGVSYVHRSYGQSLLTAGDHEGALAALAEAARLNPADASIHRMRAETFLAMQQPMNAERAYEDEIRACPHYFGGYEDLGYFYYTLARFEEAVEQFLRVRDIAPEYAPTYNYLGALYLALDRWDEARDSFERSFGLGRNYAACANLGTCYYYEHRFQDAAAMYELALEYVPDSYMVIGNLGDAYFWIPEKKDNALHCYRRALSIARSALRQSPSDPSIHAFIGGYEAIIEPDSAAFFVERSLELAPEDGEINYRACLAFEVLDRRSRALALLGKAIDQGFSARVIENEPWLQALREDPRYALIVNKDGS